MDQDFSQNIKQAIDLLQDGKTAAARNILVPLLRENDRLEEAWYLLSYTMANQGKQSYALKQALKINPNFEKAQTRLSQIEQGKPDEFKAGSSKPPKAESRPWKVSQTKPLPKLVEEDLRNDEEAGREKKKPVTSPFYDSAFMDEADDDLDSGDFKPPSGLRRRLVLSILILLVLALLVVLGRSFDFSALGSSNPDNTQAPATEVQGFRTLPPTWTPNPLGEEAILQQPTSTPLPGAEIQEVSESILIQLEGIQGQIAGLRGLEPFSTIDNYLTGFEAIQPLVDEVYGTPEFFQDASRLQYLYQVMQLGSNDLSLADYLLAQKIEPVGAFYDTEFVRIYLLSEELDLETSYAYAYIFSQALIDHEFATSQLIKNLNCAMEPDRCIGIEALLKAEARNLADQWLAEFGIDQFPEAVNFETIGFFEQTATSLPLLLERRNNYLFNGATEFVAALRDEDDWVSLNAIHALGQLSTSEIAQLQSFGDVQQDSLLTVPDLGPILSEEMDLVSFGSLGEWLSAQWLSANVTSSKRLSEDDALAAVAGWQEDQFQLYGAGENYLLAMQWRWENVTAQASFEAALSAYLTLAYEDSDAAISGASCRSSEGQVACFLSGDQQSAVIIASVTDFLGEVLPLYSDNP